jgi:glutamyl-Q tRNA(Asp) synthetase
MAVESEQPGNSPPVGRFAPSPTGPLHYGSMLSAVASYLNVRSRQGEWLVRIDDLDPPREVPGAADSILRTLEHYGLNWDREVFYQSKRNEVYGEALSWLIDKQLAYPCSCSRKDIEIRGETVYRGACRDGTLRRRENYAFRLKVPDHHVSWTDMIQGEQTVNVGAVNGDFVVRRSDGLFAYHLAVVIDDNELGVSEIIRGADLLSSTPAQKYLQHIFAAGSIEYGHIPVAVNRSGDKLSKQTGASAVPTDDAPRILYQILGDLGQQPPQGMEKATSNELLAWAIENWKLDQIPRLISYAAPAIAGTGKP